MNILTILILCLKTVLMATVISVMSTTIPASQEGLFQLIVFLCAVYLIGSLMLAYSEYHEEKLSWFDALERHAATQTDIFNQPNKE